jgi:hypothetical protein
MSIRDFPFTHRYDNDFPWSTRKSLFLTGRSSDFPGHAAAFPSVLCTHKGDSGILG